MALRRITRSKEQSGRLHQLIAAHRPIVQRVTFGSRMAQSLVDPEIPSPVRPPAPRTTILPRRPPTVERASAAGGAAREQDAAALLAKVLAGTADPEVVDDREPPVAVSPEAETSDSVSRISPPESGSDAHRILPPESIAAAPNEPIDQIVNETPADASGIEQPGVPTAERGRLEHRPPEFSDRTAPSSPEPMTATRSTEPSESKPDDSTNAIVSETNVVNSSQPSVRDELTGDDTFEMTPLEPSQADGAVEVKQASEPDIASQPRDDAQRSRAVTDHVTAVPATTDESLTPATTDHVHQPVTESDPALSPSAARSTSRAEQAHNEESIDQIADDAHVLEDSLHASDEISPGSDTPVQETSTKGAPNVGAEPDSMRATQSPETVEWRRPTRPRPPQRPAPAPEEGNSLFTQASGDQSPQSWLARLVEAAKREQHEEAQRHTRTATPSRVVADRPQPLLDPAAPPSEATRRFLAPRVGIDPAEVTVRRGAGSTREAETYQADALTRNEEIVIAAGHPEESPEGLGLLAHEFTHVVRGRQPRFVPPILRQSPDTSVTRGLDSVVPTLTGEEAIASDVEKMVRSDAVATMIAQPSPVEAATPTSVTSGEAPSRFVPPATEPAVPRSVTTQSFSTEATNRERISPPAGESLRADEWGGLPSPWEPMPAWAVSEGNVTAGGDNANSATSDSTPLSSADTALTAAGTAPAPPVMTAATSRSGSFAGSAGNADSAPHQTNTSVEPDLDALARQVYSVLKRRLAAERRRGA